MAITITPSSFPVGDYRAQVQYATDFLVQSQAQLTLHRRMIGRIPASASLLSGEVRTPSGYPGVMAFDMSKSRVGDRIMFDMVSRHSGEPVMGDEIAGDKAEAIVFQSDEVVIRQYSKAASAGGNDAQSNTPHNLRTTAMGLQLGWRKNLEDNLFHTTIAGDRGFETGDHWIVPLKSAPNFAKVMGNTLTPPTFSRKFYPGSATSIANLATTNILTLGFFDDLRTKLVKGAAPLKSVDIGDGIGGDDMSPLFICIISEDGWNQLMKDTSTQNWRNFLASSAMREQFKDNPLFKDIEFGLWRGIAVFHVPRAISFPATASVEEYDSAGVLQTVTAAVNTHRGVVMGADAFGVGVGSVKPYNTGGLNVGGGTNSQGMPYSWVEEVSDGGNQLKVYVRSRMGMKKLIYNFNGVRYDNGVAAFDYYVAP